MRDYQHYGGTKKKTAGVRAAKKSSAVNNLTINLDNYIQFYTK